MNDSKKHSLWSRLKNTNTVLIALIVTLLIIIIDYINPTGKVKVSLVIAIGIITTLIALWLMYTTNFYKLIKLHSINTLDMLLTLVSIIALIYDIYLYFVNQNNTWKFKLTLCIFIIAIVLLIIRLIYVNKSLNKQKNIKVVVDLRDLYDGKVKKTDHLVILGDQAVNYDLLNRDMIVSVLYDAIDTAYSSDAYVIGLEGEWGTGKTTIANLVKHRLDKNENICVVENFDFWTTGSSATLLQSMYDALLRALDVNYNSIRMNKLLKRTSKFVINVPTAGKIFDEVINENISQDDVNQLHEELEELILNSDKKYVFFVDDLDRASKSQVLFLLKMLGTLFNLPNLVFVLLYDKERMEKIIEEKDEINPAFEEKIINQEIRVPKASKEAANRVYKKSLNEAAKVYGISDNKLQDLELAIDLIVNQIKSIRELKRIINSVVSIAFSKENDLNKSDSLLLEYIYFEEPSLYELIKENGLYFISQDFTLEEQLLLGIQDETENTKRLKSFYDKKLTKYKKYIPLLEEMFPYVKSYYSHDRLNLYPGIITDKSKDGSRRKQRRICSSHYFDLYFSLTRNDYLKINLQIKKFVEEINALPTETEITKTFQKFVDSSKEELALKVADLRLYIDKINKDKKIILCNLLLSNIKEFSRDGLPSSRVEALFRCEDLLENSTQENIAKMFRSFNKRYDLVGNIDMLNEYAKDIDWLHNLTTKCWHEICRNILNDQVDLYNDENYEDDNAWGLYRYIDQQKLPSKYISDYLNSIMSDKNVYRILFDAISKPMSDKGFGYQLTKEYFDAMDLAHVSKLKLVLEKAVPGNIYQKRVYDVYQNFINNNKEATYYNNPINPNEL
ncbi:KAP family P-loop NTPase fold protein [Lactobacillus gallinarum]|uniref:KAP NTPase domain-containing protein n=1 Tax=Lactobacillus gallinarum TaxID=52242 RepID=A0A1Y4UEN6_9LACO|nr:P-loop NTPase fold protein [Lactobacillus gallinarum]OUQ56289.1 hypothetical protein B5E59_05290 [Lactobacillus gallinarum]OUQ75133.1 hypothetical protein B5E44_07900 [Lactobacillus gallinarum]